MYTLDTSIYTAELLAIPIVLSYIKHILLKHLLFLQSICCTVH